eukprot:scaffold111906_cov18-Tisochrysis_lutea.AAC.1
MPSRASRGRQSLGASGSGQFKFKACRRKRVMRHRACRRGGTATPPATLCGHELAPIGRLSSPSDARRAQLPTSS